jgi:elongation factor 3
MARPDSVPECIKKLSSTTFVAEVTGPALAVMVPLLSRALNERNQTVQRSTVIVVENLCKLVHDPMEASKFLPALTPGVERIMHGASFPEVREHAKSALDTLQNATKELAASKQQSDASAGAEKDVKLEGEQAKNAALDAVIACVKNASDGKEITQIKDDEWAMAGLHHVARMLVRLADKRVLQQSPWDDVYVLPYLRRIPNSEEKGKQATDALRKMYLEIDATRFGQLEDDDDDEQEGECLVNIQFSLAYGGLLLLNNTRLKLHRGHRYGIVAANGSGKSTLLKAMRDGKVDGFPTQDVLRTIMVEHSLQGEDGSQAILPFVCKTPGLEKKTKEQVAAALLEVGFDEERQQNPVGSLSGGWKMKLELARAMLNGADILLLDEPTNHLDVQSVAWLEKYLTSHNEITVLTVSHDSGFLDNVCTDIMHYENKKIRYFKGNLKRFVELKPEAKSHYSLSASVVKFSFPEPGHLMGVRSNTRTILKLTDATYTYPGMSKPSLKNASAAISLSSRVGVLGPNGAGKSTLIKCLTGEIVPQEGKVEKHPALRVALMAQHAFHHIEQHLEKTACQYIMWRYQGGQDKEISEKASRKMTDEEEKQLQVPITSKTGEQRRVEYIVGRAKFKKSFQYEIKFQGLQHKFNAWIPRERLLELGFFKMVQSFDDFENSREGSGNLELNSKVIRKHLEAMSLNGGEFEFCFTMFCAGLTGSPLYLIQKLPSTTKCLVCPAVKRSRCACAQH